MTSTTSSEALDDMGLESPDEGDLRPAVWRTVGSHFGDLLDLLRRTEPFASFEPGPWALLVALANSWRRSGVSPAARELAAASGSSMRSVFRQVVMLEDKGIVRPYRGSYTAGHVLAPILSVFASDRVPALWRFDAARAAAIATMAGGRAPNNAPLASPITHGPTLLRAALSPVAEQLRSVAHSQPEGASVRPPAECPAGTPAPNITSLNKNKKLRSSSSFEGAPPQLPEGVSPPTALARPAAGSPILDPAVSRRVACAALAALHRQAHPEFPLPRTFDASDVALVERCGANGTWDASTLEQMHLDAIQGALRTSSGPPRPFYIWGRFTHFLEHARRGRAARADATPRPRPKRSKPEEPPASPEWVAHHIRTAFPDWIAPPDDDARDKPAARLPDSDPPS